jgi:hypothetical protein
MAIIRDDDPRDQQIAATRRAIAQRAAYICRQLDLLAGQVPVKYRLKLSDIWLDVAELSSYLRHTVDPENPE